MEILFSATKLPMLGKKGVITPDAEGYYDLCVGGLNTSNNTGAWYYTAEKAKQLFEESSIFMRRVRNGAMRAEVNHPARLPGMSDEQYLNRMLDIDLNNVCAHFKHVWLDLEYGKNNPHVKNPNLIAIMAKVRPAEPKGAILLDQLKNPSENACFSIRALADEFFQGGKRIRILRDIIAIDLVNEGGILMASKWDSPALETLQEDLRSLKVTRELLERISIASNDAFATESSRDVAKVILNRYLQPSNQMPHYEKW